MPKSMLDRHLASARVRGTEGEAAWKDRENGSSPRVRGTVRPRVQLEVVRTVHPRVCGERNTRSYVAGSIVGSSPRVRGTGARRWGWPSAHRFIPACAGNGESSLALHCFNAVHPRVCGERPVTVPP